MVASGKVTKEEVSKFTFNMATGTFVRIVLLGAAVGLFTWLLALALDRYMFVPFFCQTGENVSVCSNSTVIASNIAAVLVGVMAVPLLVTIYARRAILVVVAAVVALWGASAWVAGEWFVSMIWTALASAAIYAVLSWVNRLRNTVAVVILMVLFVIAVRLVISYA